MASRSTIVADVMIWSPFRNCIRIVYGLRGMNFVQSQSRVSLVHS
jgi:hypothetical protein